MNLPSIKKAMKNFPKNSVISAAGNFYQKHDANILTAASMGCSVGALVLCFRNSNEIKGEIIFLKEQLDVVKDPEERKKLYSEHLPRLAKLAGPVIGLELGSIILSAASNKVQKDKISQLTELVTAGAMARTAYSSFRQQAIEELGEETVKQIDQKTAEEVIRNTEIPQDVEIKAGENPCYDYQFSGKIFSTTEQRLNDVAELIDSKLDTGDVVTYDFFLSKLGVKHIPEHFYHLGWRKDSRSGEFKIWVGSTLIDGKLYLTFTFAEDPIDVEKFDVYYE